ncbi:hypothetical protein PBI_DEWDROP_81 [Microbacterium phage Dewdrop]|nr:hypothetical protein PBI_LEAF_81 [Microbacterium phage Leaf]QGZ17449.1 hypothetical protein PBI_DEWDROP_81 [Microbacterium phage Dewdrop]
MATTSEHIAARDDLDLQQRLIAAAEQLGVTNAQSAVVSNLGRLVATSLPVDEESTTSLANVHAYAAETRRQHLSAPEAMPPGLNPAAVTDALLEQALRKVLGDMIPEQTA